MTKEQVLHIKKTLAKHGSSHITSAEISCLIDDWFSLTEELLETKRKYVAAAHFAPEIKKCKKCDSFCPEGYVCFCGCDNSIVDE